MRPTPSQTTDEEQAEIERLHTRRDELAGMDEDEWTGELEAEGESIEARLAEIHDAIKARAVYKPEDIAVSGCIATVGNDGRLQLVQGLVKPEDMPATDTDTSTTEASVHDGGGQQDGQHATSGIAAPAISGPAMPPARPDREAEARKEAGVGIGLADDLRAIRTALVKAHLAEDFRAAFDLMLFQMGRAVFTSGYHDHALDIAVRETRDRPPLRVNDDAFGDWSPGETMLADRSSLPFDWLEIEDRQESFAALRALPESDKQRLFAACVARTVNGQLAFEADARPELEATVARLGIEFAAHVRPTAEMFWSRVRKDRMLSVAREVLGVEWVHAHRKDKKAVLATALETAFAKGDSPPLGVTREGHAAALAWAPPGFAAYDAGRIDDRDANAPAKAEGAAPAETTTEPVPDADDAATVASSSPVDAEATTDAADGAAQPQGGAADDAPPAAQDRPRNSSVVESIVSPGVAKREARGGRAAIDAINAVPTTDGAPRVIVNTAGIDRDDAASSETDPSASPIPGNGHDAGGDPFDIPAFLRRS